MVKTHKESSFVLRTLNQINNSKDVILQTENTGSKFTSGEAVYLCEVVNQYTYSNTRTVDSILNELFKVTEENRKMRKTIEKLQKVGN